MPIPNLTLTLNDEERQEGEISQYNIVDLDLSDDEVQRAVGTRVERSEAFWNSKYDLDNVRTQNEKYYLNKALDTTALYDFQVPYKNNRLFIAIESLLPMLLSRPPQPVVTQAYNTDASEELAENLGNVLLGKYEDLYLKQKFLMVIRHLLVGYRVAYMKYRWDNTIGQLQPDGTRFGDVAVDVIRPPRIVLDEGASNPDDIPLIGEYQSSTVEMLTYKFPKMKDQIFKELGFVRGTGSQLSKRAGDIEVWFTYFDRTTGEKKEGLTWKLKSLVLGKMKNPNWNYDENKKGPDGQLQYNNFFDRPRKPYIVFNHLNLGKYLIDDTSLMEQASPLQDIVDKRGRQIVENADSANSGTIFNEEMISQDNVAALIGDPMEKLMVKGPVRDAAMRLPTNALEPYVLEDKQDARSEIDNTFGTHDPLRGQASNKNKTLGQDVLSQRADLSRTATLAIALEDGADRLYKGLTQMFKVFYDDTQMIRYTGPEGKTSFVEFSQNSVQEGMKVRVKSGSVLPDDPIAKEAQTEKMIAVFDPLSIAEGLSKPNPKEWAKRMIYYRMAPDKYMSEILGIDLQSGPGQDPSAMQEQQVMMQGKDVPPQQNPSKEHLATHQAWLQSPEFQQAIQQNPQIQAIALQHVKAEMGLAKQALGMNPDQPSTPAGQPPQQTPKPQPQPQGAAPTAPPPQATPQNNVPPQGLLGKVKSMLGF